jgi:DNA-nicking Smr family endonuclease
LSAHGDDVRESSPVEIPITGELDLHAFAPRDIPSVVEEYVRTCQKRGIRRVRLAHGRGSGVQRAVVRRVLRALPEVVSFEDAPPQAGGWGATIADLSPRVLDGGNDR